MQFNLHNYWTPPTRSRRNLLRLGFFVIAATRLTSISVFAVEPTSTSSSTNCPASIPNPTKPTPSPQPTRKYESPRQEVIVTCGSTEISHLAESARAEKGEKADNQPSPWIDLLGKSLWPLLIFGALAMFRKQIGSVLSSREVDFELGGNKFKLRSTSQSQEQAKEAKVIEDDVANTTTAGALPPGKTSRLQAVSKHYLAEDLALRALQVEYGTPIQRGVTGGEDPGFDGFFRVGNKPFIVEVRYYKDSFLPERLRAVIFDISNAIIKYKWKDPQIILVAVFENITDRGHKMNRLAKAVSFSAVPVLVKIYTIEELQSLFDHNIESNSP